MEALSQSQMIDQESKGWGGEGRARWAENLVQVEGHRRTWKAKREIAAEFSLCWCARCQTAVWVLVGTSRFSLCTAPSPPHPTPALHTHTPRRLKDTTVTGDGGSGSLRNNAHRINSSRRHNQRSGARLESIQTIRRHGGQGHPRPGPPKLCGT